MRGNAVALNPPYSVGVVGKSSEVAACHNISFT